MSLISERPKSAVWKSFKIKFSENILRNIIPQPSTFIVWVLFLSWAPAINIPKVMNIHLTYLGIQPTNLLLSAKYSSPVLNVTFFFSRHFICKEAMSQSEGFLHEDWWNVWWWWWSKGTTVKEPITISTFPGNRPERMLCHHGLLSNHIPHWIRCRLLHERSKR